MKVVGDWAYIVAEAPNHGLQVSSCNTEFSSILLF